MPRSRRRPMTTTRTTSRYIEAVPEYHQKAMDDHEKNVLAMLPKGSRP